jgi:tetratricopeptide (TPR) repeat protein
VFQEALLQIRHLLAAGAVRRAETSIAKLLRSELNPQEEAQVLTLRARARLLAARPEEALDDLAYARQHIDDRSLQTEQVEMTGDAYFARFELASVGFADRSYVRAAQECYDQIIRETPDYLNMGWIHYQSGRIHLTDGHIDEAIQCFVDALLSPSPLPGLTAFCFERLGFIHVYEKRDLKRALGFLDKALHTYPASEPRVWIVRLQTLRARVLKEVGRTSDAIDAIETAIAIAQQNDDSRIALADAILNAGELYSQVNGHEEEVISRLQQYLQITRKPPGIDVTWSRVHEMLGSAYFNLGQYSASAAAFSDALTYNPYHPWEATLQYQIARAHYHADDYERAVTAVEKLIASAANDGQPVTDYRVYDILASAQFARKRYAEALAAYDQALALAPTHVDLDKLKRYRQFALELLGRV